MKTKETDIIIIGSGIAGLYTAKLLSNQKNVILLTKGTIINSNSYWAQGGIAASIGEDDHYEDHYLDTLIAGNNHNVEEATMELVKNGPKAIQQLIALEVPFDLNKQNKIDLGREGGHHKRRIAHSGGDSTGRAVVTSLIKDIKGKFTVIENETAVQLLVKDNICTGVLAKNENEEYTLYLAEHVVLATGGTGMIYSISSNDKTITGDGLAMAYRAGAELADLEFVQFHPTMLANHLGTYGLVSEAVRGEGARLVDQDNRAIMEGIHPLKDLAPRDIVARRIYEISQNKQQVFLDISPITNFSERFPTIYQMCIDNHIDISNHLLPVSPGAHFMMGGVKVNMYGETSIKGLYAVGEVAYTGVHGANRLASNSLLEGIVFANKLADYIKNQKTSDKSKSSSFPIPFHAENSNIELPQTREIQEIMMKHVGIIRDELHLKKAKKWLEVYLNHVNNRLISSLSIDQLTRLNMLTVGWLITTSALKRTESRGAHFRRDYPLSNNEIWLKRYIYRRSGENESNQAKKASTAVIS